MLKVVDLNYVVGEKKLLDQVSLSFQPGKLNLIIGPNGAGKSTLIKAICQQLPGTSGQVYYGDQNAAKFSVLRLAQIRAVLSQNLELAFPLSVAEVVMMGRYPHFSGKPGSKDELICAEAMQLFDVQDMAERNYNTLSGGEKQRTHFARVTAQIWQGPDSGQRFLLLDEPLTFLDIYYQFDFMQKITQLLAVDNLVVVGVVHDLNLAAKFADQLVLMHEGRVLANGTPKETLTVENIRTAYRMSPVIKQENGTFYLYF